MLHERFFDAWTTIANDSVAKTAALCAELDAIEAKNGARADGLFGEVAKLTKDTLAYQAALGSAWRKLTLESMQRFADVGRTGETTAKPSV